MSRKVALKEEMDAARESKPKYGQNLRGGQARPDAGDEDIGEREDGRAASTEVGEQDGNGELVSGVAVDYDAERMIGVERHHRGRRRRRV